MKASYVLGGALALSLPVTAALAEGDTVKLGMVMSYSGWFHPIDAATINGAMLAIDEINAQGGVLGMQIEPVTFDNKSDPVLGADGATEVIAQGAKAMIVPSDFDFSAPATLVGQQAGVVMFSGASDRKFGPVGIGNMAFSISNDSVAQGALMADWAYETQGWKTAYVLLDNTISYTQTLCGSFAENFRKIGGDAALLGEDTFLNGDATIDSQIGRIRALPAQPDVVMICTYAPGGPSALRQMRAAGLNMPIISGESMDGNYWIGTVPDLSNFYALNFGSYMGDDSEAAVNDFFDRYQAKFGARSDVSYALRGYSMVEAWARAATKAGSVEPADVAAALESFNAEPLVVGPTTYSADSRIATDRPMAIMRVEKGVVSFVGRFSAPSAN